MEQCRSEAPRATHPRGVPSVATLLIVSSIMLMAAMCQPRQAVGVPVESGDVRKSELVELVKLDPTIHLDIRYATSHNFLGVRLYSQACAFLQKPAAQALVRVHRALREKGYGLLVFDGYRPWRVTKLMWDRARPEWRSGGYVADPSKGSRHNRGCAVDLTLYDLRTGNPVEMPTDYDDFHARAHAFARDVSAQALIHRRLLQNAMLAEGFQILAEEWWHFDYKDYRLYPILDIQTYKNGHDSPTCIYNHVSAHYVAFNLLIHVSTQLTSKLACRICFRGRRSATPARLRAPHEACERPPKVAG